MRFSKFMLPLTIVLLLVAAAFVVGTLVSGSTFGGLKIPSNSSQITEVTNGGRTVVRLNENQSIPCRMTVVVGDTIEVPPAKQLAKESLVALKHGAAVATTNLFSCSSSHWQATAPSGVSPWRGGVAYDRVEAQSGASPFEVYRRLPGGFFGASVTMDQANLKSPPAWVLTIFRSVKVSTL